MGSLQIRQPLPSAPGSDGGAEAKSRSGSYRSQGAPLTARGLWTRFTRESLPEPRAAKPSLPPETATPAPAAPESLSASQPDPREDSGDAQAYPGDLKSSGLSKRLARSREKRHRHRPSCQPRGAPRREGPGRPGERAGRFFGQGSLPRKVRAGASRGASCQLRLKTGLGGRQGSGACWSAAPSRPPSPPSSRPKLLRRGGLGLA